MSCSFSWRGVERDRVTAWIGCDRLVINQSLYRRRTRYPIRKFVALLFSLLKLYVICDKIRSQMLLFVTEKFEGRPVYAIQEVTCNRIPRFVGESGVLIL